MANDIDKTSPHYKGEFSSIYEVNKKFPSGGVAGDYVAIDGWAHYWNADRGTWCVNARRDEYWDELFQCLIDKFGNISGSTFMGMAYPETVPTREDGRCFYFATEPGYYQKFGKITLSHGINVLHKTGKLWESYNLLEITQDLGADTNMVVSQKTITDVLKKWEIIINSKANIDDVVAAIENLKKEFGDRVLINGDVINNVDEEDLTSTTNSSKQQIIKFKDRAYSPLEFSGKGYKILRKNIKQVSLAVVDITVASAPTADGDISIHINGTDYHITLSASTDNATLLVAQKIANTLSSALEDYDVSVVGSVVTCIRKFGGDTPVSSSAVYVNDTGATISVTDSTKKEYRNIITQSMINDANSIYEIRYDFDLEGATLEVPENCILKFEGGSLKNGIISSDNLMLYSKNYCLRNIKFSGNCTKSLIGKLDWFVERYSFNIEDKIDNTENLRQLVNCGLENVYVPSNKYIYITRTIEIYGYVNILSDDSWYNITRANEYNSIAPCIFTDSTVTMLDYHFCSNSKEVLQIGAIQFYNFKKFSAVTKDSINTPIIRISTETNSLGKDSNIAGCKLDFTIKVTERESTLIKGDKTFNAFFPNYTGIKLDANKGNISFVTINGELSHLFKAFSFTKSAGKYITAITINGKTNCAIGNEEESKGVEGCIINGEHQPIGVWDESTPYFSFHSCVLNGFVWDLGLANEIAKGLRNCDIDYHISSPRMLDHSIELKKIGNRFPDSIISYKEQSLYFPQAVPENLLNLSVYCGNVIKMLFSNKSGFEYKVDNKSIIDNTDFGYILNQNRLFGEIPYCGDTALDPINISDEPVFVANSDFVSSSHTISIAFMLDRKYAKTSNCLIYRLGTYSSDMRLKVSASEKSTFETSETEVLMVKEFPSKTTDEFYSITSVLKIKIPSTGKRYQKYEISISNVPSLGNRYISLPLIYMPLMKGIYNDKAIFESSKRPKFIEGTHIGESYYDIDLKMPIFFNGSAWTNAEGFPAKYNRERTSVRPTNLTSNDKGFRYYDTDLNMYIYWDGERWRESDGAKVEINRSTVVRCGKFSTRPNGVDIYAGFSFFNTDTHKMITWDGSKWWNSDGTEATS